MTKIDKLREEPENKKMMELMEFQDVGTTYIPEDIGTMTKMTSSGLARKKINN